ncbi:MAG: hypothetical protein A2293_06235 [Elusimicrobia bacterium RIFOXYB2_FULL_49_7]|nr:MAG: hypothetical protein A2293_06235 [Elusimicrobia bacterium RIFOXYB2_FULL_49_7]
MDTPVSPLVSVIVPTYHRVDVLRKTLSCLVRQAHTPFEVIVVDQSLQSGLSLTDFPQGRFTYLHLCHANLPDARNRGIRAAAGSLILFIDDDVEFDSSLLAEHVRAHTGHPGVAAVAGRVKLFAPHAWPVQDVISKLDHRTGKFLPNFDSDKAGPTDFFVGCHVSFKRATLDRIGRFDRHYIGNALYEEVDYALRMKKKGLHIHYHPQAILTHFQAPSGGCREQTGGRYYFIKFYNTGFFFFKHRLSCWPYPFFKAMRNEIEFYTRRSNGHDWLAACLYLTGLLLGTLRGFWVGMRPTFYR